MTITLEDFIKDFTPGERTRVGIHARLNWSKRNTPMPRDSNATSVELFSGCGGLALGLSRAGFKHLAMVERDLDAFETVTHNATAGVEHVVDWPYTRRDVREID